MFCRSLKINECTKSTNCIDHFFANKFLTRIIPYIFSTFTKIANTFCQIKKYIRCLSPSFFYYRIKLDYIVKKYQNFSPKLFWVPLRRSENHQYLLADLGRRIKNYKRCLSTSKPIKFVFFIERFHDRMWVFAIQYQLWYWNFLGCTHIKVAVHHDRICIIQIL